MTNFIYESYVWSISSIYSTHTLNSTYNKVTFNKKSAIMKENLSTKYAPFTYKYISLNEKLPITKQNLHIFFFVIDGIECTHIHHSWSSIAKLFMV